MYIEVFSSERKIGIITAITVLTGIAGYYSLNNYWPLFLMLSTISACLFTILTIGMFELQNKI
jgi:hypothetical protein